MNARIVWIIVIVVLLIVGAVVGLVSAIVFGVFAIMDRSDAHVCGLAYVQKNPAAIEMLGTPIVQHGFTGGRSNGTNGELNERLTFNVSGPKGEAFVISEGTRSPAASHLTVTLGRDQQSTPIYDGTFDCPELHAAKQ